MRDAIEAAFRGDFSRLDPSIRFVTRTMIEDGKRIVLRAERPRGE